MQTKIQSPLATSANRNGPQARLPWASPSLRVVPARTAESGLLLGPEIILLLS